MQQMRVHNPAFVPLEETPAEERRQGKRWQALADYVGRMDKGRLLVDIEGGAPKWWRHCKDRRIDKERPQ
jgi:hypothetical protein